MADITSPGKADMPTHQEHAKPKLEKGVQQYAADDETAAYTTGDAVTIDPATNRRLFWKINRRILVCMLGVCCSPSLGLSRC